ncbi:tRNA uracil 4-sulfurtransferase ThiI [Marinicella sp. W31]|uniref:tRNA uracil 4-sulfurtransferase ThiI n=1 Tax=Marinicella sp. W31 TaxID=3023713 RepID=UPI003757962A
MRYRISIFFAELSLKGANKKLFIKRLRQNLKRKLKAKHYDWPLKQVYDRIFIEPIDVAEDEVKVLIQELCLLPGISRISLGYWFDINEDFFAKKPDLDVVVEQLLKLARDSYRQDASFAVRVKRGEKRFPLTSSDTEKYIATEILKRTDWQKVNLKNPDQIFYLDISSTGLVAYSNNYTASGGLPVSTTGRVMVLMSGGFDSPTAAWLMANRGCNIDCIHFSASHIGPQQLKDYKVARIVQIISRYSGRVRLIVVPYTHFDMALMAQNIGYDVMLFRRFMARVAEQYTQDINTQALVTGDNLGQVASQTLENITALDQAVEVPILRPLLTYNKQEIIELNRQLGLYDACREPYKDCCALISSHPKTKTRDYILSRIEEQQIPDYQDLIKQSLDDRLEIVYEFGHVLKMAVTQETEKTCQSL